MTDGAAQPYRHEFSVDATGRQPVRAWLLTELSAKERRTAGAAMYQILQQQGIAVCGTIFGRQSPAFREKKR